MKLILQPLRGESVGVELKKILDSDYGNFTSLTIAVAFAKASGVRHLESQLKAFVENGHSLKIIVGIDHHGTTIEALQMLLGITGDKATVWINNSLGNYITFHPKVYLFENNVAAIIIIGSNNLTEGGLFTNDEASVMLFLNLTLERDKEFVDSLKEAFIYWSDPQTQNAKLLTLEILQQLIDKEYVLPEAVVTTPTLRATAPSSEQQTQGEVPKQDLFGKSFIKRIAPSFRRQYTPRSTGSDVGVASQVTTAVGQLGFLMTLQKTDVGSGQTTPGTSRRSPEIFIPLAARDKVPTFWGWRDLFSEDETNPGKFDRRNVRVRIGGEVVSVNMMTWPAKSDFRLRSESLRSAGNVGDILRIEKATNNNEFDYYVEIIPQQTSAYNEYLALCTERTRGSARLWGYYEIQAINSEIQ